MPILSMRIQALIDKQQAEVDRLSKAATVELPAAQQQLAQLVALQARVTPQIENLIVTFINLNIVN